MPSTPHRTITLIKEAVFSPENAEVTLTMPVVDSRAKETIEKGLAAQKPYKLGEPSEINFSIQGTKGTIIIKNKNLTALAGDTANVMASGIEAPIDRITVKFADIDLMNSIIGQIGIKVLAGHERAQVSRLAELIADKMTGRG